ncbi:MAG: hypothetical protein ACU84J_10390 [Gammaproteobacteria bacterium]
MNRRLALVEVYIRVYGPPEWCAVRTLPSYGPTGDADYSIR